MHYTIPGALPVTLFLVDSLLLLFLRYEVAHPPVACEVAGLQNPRFAP